MPELKPLPCPAWACQGELVECKQDGENFFIECTECSMRGPVECDPYHAQQSWDWIPRALRWTHEPPKVAGKYWWRPSGKKIGRIRDMFVRNGEVGFLDHNDRFIKDTGDGEWAGPIPAPLD